MLISDNILFSKLSDRMMMDDKAFVPAGLEEIFRDVDSSQIFAI